MQIRQRMAGTYLPSASNPSAVTVTLVLKKAGTIDYYCRFHPNMKATLTVGP